MTVRIINADALAALPQLAAEGVRAHSVCCDPPYHLTTGKKGGTGPASASLKTPHGRARITTGFMGQAWDGGDVAFRPETWAAVRSVMRPGAFFTAFASTRGYHRMVCAIEDAGFIIHPMLAWVFNTGFPKASRFEQPELDGWRYGLQALKPAMEPICLAQVPLDGTGSNNWRLHGCGGLNIDACRIGTGTDRTSGGKQGSHPAPMDWGAQTGRERPEGARWPSNLCHDGSPQVEAAFAAFGTSTSTGGSGPASKNWRGDGHTVGASFAGATGGFGDTGTASRFFLCAKADAADRAGSKHPTVKPAALMRWLVQLTTPPGGLVLDPFAGTGSTGLAADQLGLDAILIERDAQYAADAQRKITRDGGLFAKVEQRTPDLEAALDAPLRDLFSDAAE